MNLESFTVDAITRRRPMTKTNPTNNKSTTLPSPTLPTSSSHQQPHDQQTTLKRSLHLSDLIFYGVGCSVGAGIYSLVGIGATLAGPSIALSFALCGMACACTSLAYAEFAAQIPLAGSAYTFVYVSFGELAGWLVGWNLTLGYAVSAAVVARSWAAYVVAFAKSAFTTTSSSTTSASSLSTFLDLSINYPLFGAEYTICPLAMVIVGLCTCVLITGVKESAKFNAAMTCLNLAVLGFVLLSGITFVRTDNLQPFFPHGMAGTARGAGLVFFSYLGFDMVACLSEEVIQPQRTLPKGIVGSLLVSMMIYCSVALVVVGMTPIPLLGPDVPIVNALVANACCTHEQQVQQATATRTIMTMTTPTTDDNQHNCLAYSQCSTTILHPLLYMTSQWISFGAIFGLTTATFACLMGQPRIFYSMAQDGLLMAPFQKVHPHTGVPTYGTLFTGIATALVACAMDLESLANAISLGTLQVFTFVCAGIIVLRARRYSQLYYVQQQQQQQQDDRLVGEQSPLLSQQTLQPTNHHDTTTNRLPNTTSTTTTTTTTNVVLEPDAVVTSRWLGIHAEPSFQIRESLRNSHSSIVVPDTSSDSVISSNNYNYNNHYNNHKPVWLLVLFTISCTLGSFVISNHAIHHDDSSSSTASWPFSTLVLVVVCGITMVVTAIGLFQLPQLKRPPVAVAPSSKENDNDNGGDNETANATTTFECPSVPLVPLLGILFNSYMMGSLPGTTWVVIGVWLLVGLLFYAVYGIHHSKLRTATATTASSTTTAATTTTKTRKKETKQ